jgi:DNA-binding response OmpR family regulator
MDSKKVLLLISQSKLGDKLERSFLKENFITYRSDDPYWTIEFLQTESPQAIIVDWDYVNGITKQISNIIRENCHKTVLIILSRNMSKEQRLLAIEEGADDCIINPTEVDEIIAKVRALIRRIDLVDHSPRKIMIRDLTINVDTHEVRKGNRQIDLTYTQFKILYLLSTNRDSIFSRDEILNKIWGDNSYVTSRTVDVHVKRLREKLSSKKKHSEYIQTIHGMGYRFA